MALYIIDSAIQKHFFATIIRLCVNHHKRSYDSQSGLENPCCNSLPVVHLMCKTSDVNKVLEMEEYDGEVDSDEEARMSEGWDAI